MPDKFLQQELLDAQVLWRYHSVMDDIDVLHNSIIIGLGSYDLRVAHHCADLYKRGENNLVIFSGKNGNWTRDMYGDDYNEAQVFAKEANFHGVPHDKIILEQEATNLKPLQIRN